MLTQPFPLSISIIINDHHLKCSIETCRNDWEGINLNCLASWVNLNVAYCNTICNIKFRNIFDYSTKFFLFKTVYSDYSIQEGPMNDSIDACHNLAWETHGKFDLQSSNKFTFFNDSILPLFQSYNFLCYNQIIQKRNLPFPMNSQSPQ